MLPLLHLCDTLFPIGGFAYSDGLEAAVTVQSVEELRNWLDVCLDETIGRLDGPAVWQSWTAFAAADWGAIARVDREVTALRPSASARRSSRAMGLRLLATWETLHPHPRLEHALSLARQGTLGPTLPVAFAGACAAVGVDRRLAVESYAYTRLAATISAAMRLMPLGQTAAHTVLARALDRVPAVVDAMVNRDAEIECFAPTMDIAAMTQQYLHSRLFGS
jgi:urease accessory protein